MGFIKLSDNDIDRIRKIQPSYFPKKYPSKQDLYKSQKQKLESQVNFKEILSKSMIDKEQVFEAANSIASKVYGDNKDPEKVKGMVNKAISLAKDTEDAIGIIQSFFEEK